MSQQGERPSTEDEWWNRLYDESAPDTGPAVTAGDTLDDRFDSAVGTVAAQHPPEPPAPVQPPEPPAPVQPPEPPQPPGPPGPPEAGDPRVPRIPRVPGAPGRARPRAWWGSPQPSAPPSPSPAPPRQRAPWEPPLPPAPDPPRTPKAPPGRVPVPDGGFGAVPPTQLPRRCGARPIPSRGAPDEEPDRSGPAPDATPHATAGPQPQPQPETAPSSDSDPTPTPTPDSDPAPTLPRPDAGYVGGGPPTYDAEPTALPAVRPQELDELVADTVLDGARYGTYTLRAASVRGDSARYRGEPRRDALLTARFGNGDAALVLVAVASGARAAEAAHLAAADACRWIGGAVGRSHARLAEDIRAGRRGDLKSGLQRLTDRSFGKLRGRAAELGVEPEEYTANLRCLLLSADPDCRTRVFFGVGGGGLFRLRDGAWQDIEPRVPEPSSVAGEPVVGYGSAPGGTAAVTPTPTPAHPLAGMPAEPLSETPDGDRLTMDLGIATSPSPYIEAPPPPPADPFRFRASVARPGDTLLLCSSGLAEPLRGEPALAEELAERWAPAEPPGLATFLTDTQLRVKGYADDRTAVAVWEA
ncbi:protein phosphatase 2C domain-containing protein [Streptomyces sp. NBC_01142]|uniref:protein phosphatase 2C domain-containing protein n=1 Tax=Streptomyces sp. NBC_01142 TaxID=2975865 RepID=UPI002259EEC6|nr:protein phosphatase 2C domain-containing protein [Streptomyces sp. NBC_01142]MCX4820109.1 protein phosphatase 2C domain-containing protein [Streptomyces sp. NBC_01142]